MSANVSLPSLGVAILEAKVTRWFKEEGQKVRKEDPIAEVESDKVTFEVVSPMDGILLKKACEVGEYVKVNETLAVVGEEREQVPVDAKVDSETQKSIEKLKTYDYFDGVSNKRRATPAAKAIAEEYSVDLEEAVCPGPDGLIIKEDVLKYIESNKKLQQQDTEEDIIPFTGVRKQIADRLSESMNKQVQVTTVVEVDMTEVDHLRQILKASLKEKEGINITFVPFVVRAALDAIRFFPIINSTLDEDKIRIKKYVNFGIAVESPNGLIVPVIKNSQKLTFWETVRGIDKMVSFAKENKLTPEYIGGGTFTLSNAGAYGSVLATPVIQYPQSAILWMGLIAKRPVVRNDEIVIRKIMNLCITYDHKVMDGATAAQFLEKVRKNLEEPGSLLIE